ncbi:hypothetical protein FB480_102157 [Agrobacterium vitis]|nr:hypothetical protein FB480_102157 [Agrobacterium vitis]
MAKSVLRTALFSCLISMCALLPSVALELHASNELPFSFKVVGIADKQASGVHFSVVTIRLVNGSRYLNRVLIHCDAKNQDGFSWAIEGKALNLEKNATREFMIVNEGSSEDPAYTSKASSVECRVSGFDSAL